MAKIEKKMSPPPKAEKPEKERDPYDVAVGRRLRLAREALRMTQKVFASRASIETNAYGQYETGARSLHPKLAVDLCKAHKLTLEYIYMDEPGDMPYKLTRAIQALSAMDEPDEPKAGA